MSLASADSIRQLCGASLQRQEMQSLQRSWRLEFGGGAAGEEVLQAMVRANLFAYRPVSSWAQDNDNSAFKDDDVLITAPTPADLACMRGLKLPESAPSAGTVSCAALHLDGLCLACHSLHTKLGSTP